MADERFTFEDFRESLVHVGEHLPVVGGQAVGWWVRKYREVPQIANLTGGAVTSRDLDLWGESAEVKSLARKLGVRATLPHKYEMTVLAGVIEFEIGGRKAHIEVLHTIPGLDCADKENATVSQKYGQTAFSILDPVSLLSCKLHALRNYGQDGRNDLLHVQILIPVGAEFIRNVLEQEPMLGLWYLERALKIVTQQNNRRAAKKHRLNIFKVIPADWIGEHLQSGRISGEALQKLKSFTNSAGGG